MIEDTKLTGSSNLSEEAKGILGVIGGKDNILSIDACVTRIRLSLVDGSKMNEKMLKKLGISGVMKMGEGNYQIVVGTLADPIVTQMKKLLK